MGIFYCEMCCFLLLIIVLGTFEVFNNGMFTTTATNVNNIHHHLIDLTRLAWASDGAGDGGPVTNFRVELSNSCTDKYANRRPVLTFIGKKLASLEAVLVRIKWRRPNDEFDEATEQNEKRIGTLEGNDFGVDSSLEKEENEPIGKEKERSQTLFEEGAKMEEVPSNRIAEIHVKNDENEKENAPFIEFDTVLILRNGSEEVGQKMFERDLIRCIAFQLRNAHSSEPFGTSFDLSHLKEVTLKIGLKPIEVPNKASSLLKWIHGSMNEEGGNIFSYYACRKCF